MNGVREFWMPLEARPIFLIKTGALSDDSIRALIRHQPGSLAIATPDIDAVRVLAAVDEPLDRIAGAISEDC